MKTAIKTMKAPVLWNKENIKVVFNYGDKDDFEKTIWYDEDGNAYEMIYARITKQYSLNPYPYYNK